MRTLPAAQSTSAYMHSITPVHLHVLDIINHSISWYLYMSLTMAAASCMMYTLSYRHLAHKHRHCTSSSPQSSTATMAWSECMSWQGGTPSQKHRAHPCIETACTIACYSNITTAASTDPQTALWMHEPFSNAYSSCQLSLAHKRLLGCIHSFILCICTHSHTVLMLKHCVGLVPSSLPFTIPPAQPQNTPTMIPAWGDPADTMINTCMSNG
jgi:hypothetical protein